MRGAIACESIASYRRRTGPNAMAPGMPMTKKTQRQANVESHTVLLTLTFGFFSLTHDGTGWKKKRVD